MTPFEREIERQRRRIMRIERNGASDLVRSYLQVYRRLTGQLAEVTAMIEAAGDQVRPSWLHRQAHFQALLTQVEQETRGFAERAIEIIRSGQNEALIYAPRDAQALALAAIGTAPRQIVAQVETRFSRLPDDALRRLVGNASDGMPLGDLLGDMGKRAAKRASDTLVHGVATGQNPRVIAREFRKASGQTLTRSLVIARTETLGAYRQATLDTYRLNPDVVRGWTWHASLDDRTCPSCYAMHGTEHTLEEGLDSHPQCRCAMVPRTASWQELGFAAPDTRPDIASGEELFARLTDLEQRQVLGPAKFEAYQAGEVGRRPPRGVADSSAGAGPPRRAHRRLRLSPGGTHDFEPCREGGLTNEEARRDAEPPDHRRDPEAR